MNNHGTAPKVIRVDRGAIVFLLLLSLAASVGILYGTPARHPKLFLFTVAVLSIAYLCSFSVLVRCLWSDHALVVTGEGLVVRPSGRVVLRWDEIRGARVTRFMGDKFVELEWRDEEARVARLGPVQRVLTRFRMHTGLPGCCLPCFLFEGGADAVVRVIEEHLSGGRGGCAV